MGVAPQELDGVVTHLHLVNGAHVLGHGIRVQTGPAGHLFHTVGAPAPQPQQPVGIDAPVAVIPQDDDVVTGNIYLFGFDRLFSHNQATYDHRFGS
jgi:hypothetical protein